MSDSDTPMTRKPTSEPANASSAVAVRPKATDPGSAADASTITVASTDAPIDANTEEYTADGKRYSNVDVSWTDERTNEAGTTYVSFTRVIQVDPSRPYEAGSAADQADMERLLASGNWSRVARRFKGGLAGLAGPLPHDGARPTAVSVGLGSDAVRAASLDMFGTDPFAFMGPGTGGSGALGRHERSGGVGSSSGALSAGTKLMRHFMAQSAASAGQNNYA
ncbi:hypothetical protein Q5752_006139 [Cryptotrichosporon argae]